ncbi:cysteine desulfurase [Jiella sp. MQZ9-1]|uniref:Cysteine desulfurase n=1 Tax=Jiella flava TaxID=2816857 RepID=A0A939G0C0_9HYPH|nr:cysteine desulfurase family protein [Jiella flava]MBO0662837.1 cysteine desulfurase [Jiella flava]MCD2471402.1 cysteine desulfurase [Jiella flava]
MTSRDKRIYLDHNASAPLLPEAREAAVAALSLANPSSTHREGRAARAVCEDARSAIVALVGAALPAENVVLTSGATEAATQLLSPDWLIDGTATTITRLAVIDTDHPATREGGRFAETAITRLAVDHHGIVDLAVLTRWLEAVDEPAMLALSWANSETGVIQPVAEIRQAIADKPIILVLDAAQVAGRATIAMDVSGADAVILSGHKVGAMKGAGAIVLKSLARRPFALLRGGGQERGLRSGTEALPAIASFGAAAKALCEAGPAATNMMRGNRDHMERLLKARIPDLTILGNEAERLPNTIAIMHPLIRAETAQIALDLAGIAVSAGSACSSGKVGASHVVAAMAAAGLPIDAELGAIRVSFGRDTAKSALERFVSAYEELVARARAKAGRAFAA